MSFDPKTALAAARTAADVFLAIAEIAGADPKELISEAAIRRANKAADLAEDAKFGPDKPDGDTSG